MITERRGVRPLVLQARPASRISRSGSSRSPNAGGGPSDGAPREAALESANSPAGMSGRSSPRLVAGSDVAAGDAEPCRRATAHRGASARLDPSTRPRSAATPRPARAGRASRRLNYPEFDLCAPLDGAGRVRRGDLRAGPRTRGRPVRAPPRTCRACASPGGHVIVSTPFLIKVHELPMFGMHDYWRFTPRGLRDAAREGRSRGRPSAPGATAGVVGNLDRWSAHRRWHPLHNEPESRFRCWAFARNPA